MDQEIITKRTKLVWDLSSEQNLSTDSTKFIVPNLSSGKNTKQVSFFLFGNNDLRERKENQNLT